MCYSICCTSNYKHMWWLFACSWFCVWNKNIIRLKSSTGWAPVSSYPFHPNWVERCPVNILIFVLKPIIGLVKITTQAREWHCCRVTCPPQQILKARESQHAEAIFDSLLWIHTHFNSHRYISERVVLYSSPVSPLSHSFPSKLPASSSRYHP